MIHDIKFSDNSWDWLYLQILWLPMWMWNYSNNLYLEIAFSFCPINISYSVVIEYFRWTGGASIPWCKWCERTFYYRRKHLPTQQVSSSVNLFICTQDILHMLPDITTTKTLIYDAPSTSVLRIRRCCFIGDIFVITMFFNNDDGRKHHFWRLLSPFSTMIFKGTVLILDRD